MSHKRPFGIVACACLDTSACARARTQDKHTFLAQKTAQNWKAQKSGRKNKKFATKTTHKTAKKSIWDLGVCLVF